MDACAAFQVDFGDPPLDIGVAPEGAEAGAGDIEEDVAEAPGRGCLASVGGYDPKIGQAEAGCQIAHQHGASRSPIEREYESPGYALAEARRFAARCAAEIEHFVVLR